MKHNLQRYHDILLHENGYGAATQFSSSYAWHPLKTGDVLIDTRNKQNAVISVVSRVLENRLDCTPSGNFSDRPFDKLATSKYHLLLGVPEDTVFAADYDIAMQNLESVQQKIAPGKVGQNLIVLERDKKVLRFTRPVFEPHHPQLSG